MLACVRAIGSRDSAAVSTADSHSDSRADRPRRYPPCDQLHACAVRLRACARATRRGCERTWDGSHVRGTVCLAAVLALAVAVVVCVIGRFARVAAGATWRSRTTSAPWAGRYGHTTVIDAAGAIYVIGGTNGTAYFNDVLVSTDGGADCLLEGYSRW